MTRNVLIVIQLTTYYYYVQIVLMTPSPFITGWTVQKYLGRINVFLIRESTSIREVRMQYFFNREKFLSHYTPKYFFSHDTPKF